ncbi:MAG: hypothetical protein JO211_11955 [Acidobacteriaceae bacterium]|nr:hypothetical protein [Acidobacteriaceae bacterium]
MSLLQLRPGFFVNTSHIRDLLFYSAGGEAFTSEVAIEGASITMADGSVHSLNASDARVLYNATARALLSSEQI